MPVKKRLDEAFDEIMTAILDKLEAEAVAGGRLEGIEEVVRGDRSRPRPNVPAIWVFAERANPDPNPRTIAETWTLPISLTAIYKSDDPEEGQKESTRFSALARSVVIEDRSLGLREFVQDTRSGHFEPSGPHHNRGSLWGSVAQVVVKFVTCE